MIELFDADCGCLGIGPAQKNPVRPDDLAEVMDRLSVGRALVRYGPIDLAEDVVKRNGRLFDLAEQDDRVVPCPSVVPSSGLDVPEEPVQVHRLIERGARAVTVHPVWDTWLVEPFVCDKLFDALQQRRLPVVASVSDLPIDKVATLAGRFPELPFVVVGLGYRSARDVNALLDTFENVRISLGHNYTVQGVIEQLVPRYGAGRFVLGTGFPTVDPGGALTQLTYARISDDDKQTIGHGTLSRLVGEVVQ